MQYNWEGDVIIRDTIVPNKRAVIGYKDIYIPTDIRQWVAPEESEVIKETLKSIEGLPVDKSKNSFDKRALLCWNYVINNVEYVFDKKAQGMLDFWQMPSETITLCRGDCEDTTFALVSLMLSSGISPFCIRAIIGTVKVKNDKIGHAWPIYKNEAGKWCLLESTLDTPQSKLPEADPLTQKGVKFQYIPEFCFNQYHLWQIKPSTISLNAYFERRKTNLRKRRIELN